RLAAARPLRIPVSTLGRREGRDDGLGPPGPGLGSLRRRLELRSSGLRGARQRNGSRPRGDRQLSAQSNAHGPEGKSMKNASRPAHGAGEGYLMLWWSRAVGNWASGLTLGLVVALVLMACGADSWSKAGAGGGPVATRPSSAAAPRETAGAAEFRF